MLKAERNARIISDEIPHQEREMALTKPRMAEKNVIPYMTGIQNVCRTGSLDSILKVRQQCVPAPLLRVSTSFRPE